MPDPIDAGLRTVRQAADRTLGGQRRAGPVRPALLGALLLLLFALPMFGGEARAQSTATLDVQVTTISAQPVLSGNRVSWQIDYTCASIDVACEGATMILPRPDGMGDRETQGGVIQNLLVDSSQVASFHFQGGATNAYVVTFVDPLPAGSTGQMTVIYGTNVGITPDGTVFTLEATFDATNAEAVSASDTVTIAAEPNIGLIKERVSPALFLTPALDSPVTYRLSPCTLDSNSSSGTNSLPGTWYIENAVIVDTLPPGSVFVGASNGGVYDPIAHTVTWPADTYGFRGCDYLRNGPVVSVIYPSTVFTVADVPVNTATVSGNAYGEPSYLLEANDDESHALADGLARGNYRKDPTNEALSGMVPGFVKRFAWNIAFSNTGTTSWDSASITNDSLPTYFIPTEFYLVRSLFGLGWNSNEPFTRPPTELRYATNLDPSFRVVALSQEQQNPVVNVNSFGLAPGEFITDVELHVNGESPPSAAYGFQIAGYIDPAILETGATQITNCATFTAEIDGGATTVGPVEDCGDIPIIPPEAVPSLEKRLIPDIVVPGNTVDIRLAFGSDTSRGATLDFAPVVVDLLPEGLRYVPGSVSYPTPYGTPWAGGVEPLMEIIEDYNGTGRQLLRWSWPGGETIPYDSLGFRNQDGIVFQAEVVAATPVGDYTNTAYITVGAGENHNKCGWVFGGARTAAVPDELDLDGDGDFTDILCAEPANYTIGALAVADAAKQSQGGLDSAWTVTPDVAATLPGADADFRLAITNTGNVTLTNLVAYDILPYVGDTGVSSLQASVARGSEWQPVLEGVSAPDGPTISYSLSTNPCRIEVDASGPAGCVDDWTTTAPIDLGTVRALKFEFGAFELLPGESTEIVLDMLAPADTPNGLTAWNSFAYVTDAVNGTTLLVSEPPKAGIQLTYGTVFGHLYLDTNGNGVQDAGEPDLANVDVIITDANGVQQTVSTDANGDWTASVPPGSTTADVDESDPDYPTGYTQTEGDDPTTVTAVAGQNTSAGNDGYYLPGHVELLKLTDGVIVGPDNTTWNFTLSGPGLSAGDSQDAAGIVDFDGVELVPGATYTLCETGIPAGWTSEWMVDTSGDGVADAIIPMVNGVNSDPVGVDGYSNVYDPNYVAPPEQYTNDTRCVDFIVEPGETLDFQIDNSFPGGDPRTIGFWKNWNTCSGGNQAETAAGNAGTDEGWYILDDVLNNPGITIGTLTMAGTTEGCQQAVSLLDKSDIATDEKKSSDAAYNLAAQLLAATVNLSAGAETCEAVTATVADAQTLLVSIGFDGTGDYLRSKGKDKSIYTYANELAAILDSYNNGQLCDGGGTAPPPPPPPPPADGALHLESMTASPEALKGGRWQAVVLVEVRDENGAPVEGAAVSGSWSGGANGSASCTTDASGQCQVSKTLKAEVASVTFSVTEVYKEGFSYDAGSNVVAEVIVDGPTQSASVEDVTAPEEHRIHVFLPFISQVGR